MTGSVTGIAAVLRAVSAHHASNGQLLHLVPSENGLSAAARIPHLMEAAVRYAFPGPEDGGENWAWPGQQDLVVVERNAAARLGAQLGAAHVNLKTVSGVSALTVALSALAEPRDLVFNLGERDGGHGSTRFIGHRLGLGMTDLPFNQKTLTVDLDALKDQIDNRPHPALIYLDAFMCLFPVDLAGLRQVVGSQTLIHYDASHTLGLIAGGQFQNPLAEGADSLGGSTHKTYPGPHKGVLATNDLGLASRLDEHASYFVSHHHPADVVALAVAAAEMDIRGAAYAKATVANARRLGAGLAERGFDVCGKDRGFTACHQLWIDVAALCEPEEASRRLYQAGITVNAIPIPHIQARAGLRLGVQEVSWAGMGAPEMDELAQIFTAVLRDGADPAAAGKQVRTLVETYRSDDAAQRVLHAVLNATGGGTE